jgi:hypothetical protein
VSFLRRLRARPASPAGAWALPAGGRAESAAISFHQLVRQLASADPAERSEAALVLSALRRPEAIQALVRAYVERGEAAIAEALGAYGARVTPVAAREARDLARSASQRARALDLLGRIADPAARAALRAAADDPEPVVHVAACVALVRVDDEVGADRLGQGLEARDQTWRALALRTLRASADPRADAIIEGHVTRFLAAGGAIPASIAVTMPVFLDLAADLARCLGAHVSAARAPFVLVTGPATGHLAETQRETLRPYLANRRLFFTTARHSPPEQVEVLLAARAASAQAGGVVHVGPVPDPTGIHHLPPFLDRAVRRRDAALVIYVGPQSGAVVVAWWRFLADQSAVPADLTVVLTNLSLGGRRLGDEAWEVYQRCLGGREDAFARAYLARLPETA